jgi:succinate dehydrogenase/fumarate reductase flavoprotein subunit
MDDAELKVGGYTFKAAHALFALPILSAVAGGAYWGYDVLNRFLDVESGFEEVVEATSRIQALEQTIGDNDVAQLGVKLSQISTQMATILDQQRTLLDLRSKVEKSSTITDSLGDKLNTYDKEIDDIWDAMDELYENPLK